MAYETVNASWPAGTHDGCDLKPTPQEAMAAARRLWRFAMKRPWRGPVRLTSGKRYTRIRRGVLYVNPDHCGMGWHQLVHSMSHRCAFRLYPGKKPHSPQHAFLEKEMIQHVITSGWLEGKLRRPEKVKPAVDLQEVRHQRVLARVKAWEAKRKRAETALRKLRRQVRYYAARRSSPSPTRASAAPTQVSGDSLALNLSNCSA